MKIAALVLGVAALILTFRGNWVLKAIFKISEPSQKQILNLKFAALIIAIIAFVTVFRV